MEALEFWNRSRAYPDNDIPMDRYYRAYESAKTKMREAATGVSAGSIWQPIGPTNLQGRALSVALNPKNPNTIYVGTASGGLWRSYTGGTGGDWRQLKLGFPALGVSAIVIDPTDTNTIYIGTGEVYGYQSAIGGLVIRTTRGSYGIGILKTTDGGLSWTKSLDWSLNNQTGVQAMKMNPHNRRTLWAATTEGLLKTTDAGAIWSVALGGNVKMVEDIVINPLDTTKMLVSVGNFFTSNYVLRTTDGGTNWLQTSLPGYTGKTLLEMYGANPNTVFASAANNTTGAGALYKSNDFGITWIKLIEYAAGSSNTVFGTQGWYSHFVAVHPTDSTRIVHAGVPVYTSSNGGQTFGRGISEGVDHHGYAHHPANPNILYVANDDGVHRSDNFGGSFVSVGLGMQTGQFYNGFSCSATDSLLALGQSQDHIPGYLYTGYPGWGSGAVDEVGWTAIDPSNDNIMYAMDRYGWDVYRSTDRGIDFSVSGSFAGLGAWNSPLVLSPANPSMLYFGDNVIHKSVNGGGSWTTMYSAVFDGNPFLSMAAAASDANTVYAGTAPIGARAHIVRTTNAGSSWSDVTGSLPDRYPIDMAVDPINSSIVYVTFGGFGTGHVYKSTDAGGSWMNVTGTLPDIPTTAVAIDPIVADNIYVGNDLSVYLSTDGGGSWSAFGEGFPDAVILADLTISPANRALRAATHGNGVWERKLAQPVGPRVYLSTAMLDFGNVLTSTSSTLPLTIASVGTTPLMISSITHGNTEYTVSNLPSLPVTLPANGSVQFKVTFQPVSKIVINDTITVTSNDLVHPQVKIVLRGRGISIAPAQRGVVYAVSNAQPEGSLYTIGTSTAGTTSIGSLGISDIRGLAVRPSTKEVYGTKPSPTSTELYLISCESGATILAKKIPVGDICAIAFSSGDVLYGGTSTGKLYRINIATGDAVPLGATPDLSYWALALSPVSGKLWASARTKDDSIFVINTSTGTAQSVGAIGYIAIPRSLTFDTLGRLYCLIDNGSGEDYFATLDTLTGNATLVSENPLSVQNLSAIAMRSIVFSPALVEHNVQMPKPMSLCQNYPNPFNPTTTIRYSLPKSSNVKLTIYDIQGREIARLVDGQQSAGWKEVQWNASRASSGIYFYRIEAGRFVDAKKMLLIK